MCIWSQFPVIEAFVQVAPTEFEAVRSPHQEIPTALVRETTPLQSWQFVKLSTGRRFQRFTFDRERDLFRLADKSGAYVVLSRFSRDRILIRTPVARFEM